MCEYKTKFQSKDFTAKIDSAHDGLIPLFHWLVETWGKRGEKWEVYQWRGLSEDKQHRYVGVKLEVSLDTSEFEKLWT